MLAYKRLKKKRLGSFTTVHHQFISVRTTYVYASGHSLRVSPFEFRDETDIYEN